MRGFSQLEARQRLGVQRVRPFVVLQLRPNLMSLSHSAVRLSLPCAEKLPRRRDWKNVSQALESASPAIAPARPLLPHHLAFRPCRRDRTRSLTGAPFFQVLITAIHAFLSHVRNFLCVSPHVMLCFSLDGEESKVSVSGHGRAGITPSLVVSWSQPQCSCTFDVLRAICIRQPCGNLISGGIEDAELHLRFWVAVL